MNKKCIDCGEVFTDSMAIIYHECPKVMCGDCLYLGCKGCGK